MICRSKAVMSILCKLTNLTIVSVISSSDSVKGNDIIKNKKSNEFVRVIEFSCSIFQTVILFSFFYLSIFTFKVKVKEHIKRNKAE